MKSVTYHDLKAQEGQRRVNGARQARRSARAASFVQRRVSLVGRGAKWRITNWWQVVRAMAQWA